MDLQSSDFPNKYSFFNNLIQAINTFASLQGYGIVKKRTKVSKKRVLKKAILIYNQSKKYHTRNWYKKETIIRKIDCFFDALIILKIDKQIFWLCNISYNHKITLPRAHPIYQKNA